MKVRQEKCPTCLPSLAGDHYHTSESPSHGAEVTSCRWPLKRDNRGCKHRISSLAQNMGVSNYNNNTESGNKRSVCGI